MLQLYICFIYFTELLLDLSVIFFMAAYLESELRIGQICGEQESTKLALKKKVPIMNVVTLF